MNDPSNPNNQQTSRRDALKPGVAAGAVNVLAAGRPFIGSASDGPVDRGSDHAPSQQDRMEGMSHGDYSGTVGEVDLKQFDPTELLTTFDWGKASVTDDGITVREWDMVATEKEIEVAPGVFSSLDLQ